MVSRSSLWALQYPCNVSEGELISLFGPLLLSTGMIDLQQDQAGALSQILQILLVHRLYAKLSKCSFLQTETTHISVTADSISTAF